MAGCLSDDLLARFVDGTLEDPALAAAEAHLASCSDCRQVVAGTVGASPSDGIPPERLIGRYLVLGVLGAGAMGVVYLAYDPELDRKVAVKLLRPDPTQDAAEDRARLLREAKAMAQITDPHVVAVYDAGTFGDRVFVAMEHVPGETLSAWAKREPRSWRAVVALFAACGRGLAAAHAAGVVHRDFKPDNVLVSPDGRAKVTDFGLARAIASAVEAAPLSPDSAPAPTTVTATGALRGTPAYMAPEQLRGEVADARADQFGFGVALHEALTGERPFRGASVAELRATVLAGARELPALRPLPGAVRRIVERTLRPRPEERFATMTDAVDALEKATARRAAWPIAGAACLAVAALVAGRATRAPATPCAGAGDGGALVWPSATRDSVHAAFAATRAPFAEDAWNVVDGALSSYVKAYAARRVEACEATRVRGEQSDEMLDLRMQCLDARLAETTSLVKELGRADAKVVARAAVGAVSLPSLELCADRAFLRARVALPSDPATRAKVSEREKTLADARTATRFGDAARASSLLDQVEQDARTLGYAPLEAAALDARGAIQFETGDATAGERSLYAALALAEKAHDDDLAARVWTRLADVTSTIHGLGRKDEGAHLMVLASAAIERAGNPWEQRLHFEQLAGLVAKELGQVDDAIRHHEAAVALAAEKLGEEHYEVGSCHIYLAQDLRRSVSFARAEEHYLRGLRIVERTLGPNHPRMAKVHHDLAVLYGILRRFDDATASFARAERVLALTAPASHRDVAQLEHSVGETLLLAERPRDALPHLERARTIGAETLPADHPLQASIASALGRAKLDAGDPRAARPDLERALAMYEHFPEEPPMRADTEFAMARLLDALRVERLRAVTLARAARTHYAEGNALYAPERGQVDAWLASHDAPAAKAAR